ncbi:ABC transporter substrate-binding protein [Marinobacteraceae bacterium S3BR75-40.1]
MLAGSGNLAFSEAVANRLQQRLGDAYDLVPYEKNQKGALIITLGAARLSEVIAANPDAPVLALFVTEDDYQSIVPEARRKQVSALYDNPPLLRQAMLGRLILPKSRRVALLATPAKRLDYQPLLEQLEDRGFEARVFVVESNDTLINTLSRALLFADLLLGTPDPAVYNRSTIKHLLLTAYRHNRILIGPSRAYVKAGALASTYTSVKTFLDLTASRIQAFVEDGELQSAGYPTEFEVALNNQVARSLNILLPDAETLQQELLELEEDTP